MSKTAMEDAATRMTRAEARAILNDNPINPNLTTGRLNTGPGTPWYLQNLRRKPAEFFAAFRRHVTYQLRTYGYFDQTRGDHGTSGKYQYDEKLGVEMSSKQVGIMASRIEGRDTKGENQYDIVGNALYGDIWDTIPKQPVGRIAGQ